VKPKVVEEVSSGNNNIDMKMPSDQDVSLVRDSTQITTPSATMNVQSLIEQARCRFGNMMSTFVKESERTP
jgi:hypothetical protein